jgi:flagellar protein FliL
MAKKPEKKVEKKPDGDPAAAAAKPAGGMIGLIILGAAALGSSFGIVYFLTPPPAVPAEQDAAVVEPAIKADQTYVQMQEILITVGSAPATRYLKMNVSVITETGNVEAVQAAEPVLVDAFNTYLRSLEMKDFEDPGFYPRMREQLARRSELVLGSGVSDGVLITEFLLR